MPVIYHDHSYQKHCYKHSLDPYKREKNATWTVITKIVKIFAAGIPTTSVVVRITAVSSTVVRALSSIGVGGSCALRAGGSAVKTNVDYHKSYEHNCRHYERGGNFAETWYMPSACRIRQQHLFWL